MFVLKVVDGGVWRNFGEHLPRHMWTGILVHVMGLRIF